MTTDYRALCAELNFIWGRSTNPDDLFENMIPLIDRARALLAQPVAEGPTDEEIEEWADACSEAPLEEMDPDVHGWRRCFTAKEFSETIRAALSRWGRPAAAPVAMIELITDMARHLAHMQEMLEDYEYFGPEDRRWYRESVRLRAVAAEVLA